VPGEFARSLVRLWRDRTLGEELAREGHRTVEPFTPAHIAETVARHYRDVLGVGDNARSYSAAYAEAMVAAP
jgi:hypothetical protein